MHPIKKEKQAIVVTVLIAILVAVAISRIGFMDKTLQFESDHLVITGPYGSTIPLEEIDSVYLIEKRPEAIRIRGYQMGYRKKGRFRNKRGEEFLMLITSRALPWIVIRKKNGEKIYYSHSRKSSREIYSDLMQTLPYSEDIPSGQSQNP